MTLGEYLDLDVTWRWLLQEALGDLIALSNERGSNRPKDER